MNTATPASLRPLHATVTLLSLARHVASRTALRFAMALAIGLAATAPTGASLRPDAERDGRNPGESGCHCAVHASTTVLPLRGASDEQSRVPQHDADADVASTSHACLSIVARSTARTDAPRPAALDPRAGYDATAPPATPLA